ncbi:hypothetical protein ACN28S_29120 [Cystobacter fuscus]
MPRLVERLDDWGAVRLGSLGTPREDVAHILNRKRTSFLVKAIEAYGVLKAEGLALFIVDSAHDDDLREISSCWLGTSASRRRSNSCRHSAWRWRRGG